MLPSCFLFGAIVAATLFTVVFSVSPFSKVAMTGPTKAAMPWYPTPSSELRVRVYFNNGIVLNEIKALFWAVPTSKVITKSLRKDVGEVDDKLRVMMDGKLFSRSENAEQDAIIDMEGHSLNAPPSMDQKEHSSSGITRIPDAASLLSSTTLSSLSAAAAAAAASSSSSSSASSSSSEFVADEWVRVQWHGCEMTEWISESSVRCKAGRKGLTGGARSVVVSMIQDETEWSSHTTVTCKSHVLSKTKPVALSVTIPGAALAREGLAGSSDDSNNNNNNEDFRFVSNPSVHEPQELIKTWLLNAGARDVWISEDGDVVEGKLTISAVQNLLDIRFALAGDNNNNNNNNNDNVEDAKKEIGTGKNEESSFQNGVIIGTYAVPTDVAMRISGIALFSVPDEINANIRDSNPEFGSGVPLPIYFMTFAVGVIAFAAGRKIGKKKKSSDGGSEGDANNTVAVVDGAGNSNNNESKNLNNSEHMLNNNNSDNNNNNNDGQQNASNGSALIGASGNPVSKSTKRRILQKNRLLAGAGAGDSVTESPREMKDGVLRIGRITVYVAGESNLLGRGSHGTLVYRGCLDRRPVAVKRLLTDFYNFADREVELLIASDSHPSVVRYFAKEVDDTFVYLALELCLRTLAEQVLLWTEAEVRSVAVRKSLKNLLDGVAHLHSLGIVHRDLKPANILVFGVADGGDVHLKLSDMGLSKRLIEGQSSFDTVGPGSFGWRAPEQLRNERCGRGVDVFALGCVIHIVSTKGLHPFGNDLEREANIAAGRMDVSALRNFPETQDLVAKMINDNPLERPTVEDAAKHPYFWSDAEKLQFLVESSDMLEASQDSEIMRRLELTSGDVFIDGDWRKDVGIDVVSVGTHRKYDTSTVRDLLRLIRNRRNHFWDLPENVQAKFGSSPDAIFNYFCLRFPSLLLTVYELTKDPTVTRLPSIPF